MKNRILAVAALGAVGVVVPSAFGQVWAVQPALQRIIMVDPATGTIVNSFPAPDALAPIHREIGLSIAEADTTLLYHNSGISTTTLYRLSPINGAVLSVEAKDGWPVDGLSWQQAPAGPAFVYTSHYGSDVHRAIAYGGGDTFGWQGVGTPRGGLGGDGHGREFLIAPFLGGMIYEYAPFASGVNVNSFAAPTAGFALEGLAFDGVSLYVGDTAGNLFTLNPNTGAVLNMVTVAGGGLYGLAAIVHFDVDCQPGDVIEGEFEGGAGCGIPIDVFNGGCNSVPEVFSSIDCGQTVCGTAAFDGQTRDTDWYQVCVSQPTSITWYLDESEFDWVIFILDDACPPTTIFASNSGPSGDSGYVTFSCLPPGCYNLVVAPDFTLPRVCPSQYRARLECVDCVVECELTDIIEREFQTTGGCGVPNDTFNGSCNSVPVPLYSPIQCGDVICGTAEFNGAIRDTDWYLLCLAATTNVTWTVLEAEFDWVAFIIDDLCPPTILASATGTAPIPGSVTACLPAGCYALFVAPQFTTQRACPSDYRVQVTCTRGVCQGGADCNENKIDDAADIAAGTSRDCFDAAAAPGTAGGPNGIPDECECVADWNRDGVANSTDVSDFINTYFADQASGGVNADIDCNGVSNSTDVSEFINTFFAAQGGQLPFAGCTV